MDCCLEVTSDNLDDMTVALGMPQVRTTRDVEQSASTTSDDVLVNWRGLNDQFGRTATDLRVSVTDRCNLRCTYCMPAEGMQWLQKSSLMTRAEAVHLIALAISELGVRKVRFTGGEPLVRPDLVDIIRDTRSRFPDVELALTTNGVSLDRWAQPLADAGLQRVNVSLDTIDPAEFAERTRRPWLERVLRGITAAADAGLTVKTNAVLQWDADHSGQSWQKLIAAMADRHLELRFIEQMPIGDEHAWTRTSMATARDLLEVISKAWEVSASTEARDGAPAERFILKRGEQQYTLGIIASVTRSFCADCQRTRLTADGCVRTCLFSHRETPLLSALRGGASDAELATLWQQAMWHKPQGHQINERTFTRPTRTMSAIGG